jgi:hypothetical protein
MRGIGHAHRALEGTLVKLKGTTMHSPCGDGELGASTEAKKIRRAFTEKLRVEKAGWEPAVVLILAPRNEKPLSERVVGVIKETIPEEGVRNFFSFHNGPQALVKIRGMVERMALAEDRHRRDLPVAPREMGQVGVSLPTNIRKHGDLHLTT